MLISRVYTVCAIAEDIDTGDQLPVMLFLDGSERILFHATAQKRDGDKVLFMFDDCIASLKMYSDDENIGDYEESDIAKWLNNTLLPTFSEDIREHITSLTIPTAEQIFGTDDKHGHHATSLNSIPSMQLDLMKKSKNRIAVYRDRITSYWLQNKIGDSYFAKVNPFGNSSSARASSFGGVRPVFWYV
jgi:hypothetical protein